MKNMELRKKNILFGFATFGSVFDCVAAAVTVAPPPTNAIYSAGSVVYIDGEYEEGKRDECSNSQPGMKKEVERVATKKNKKTVSLNYRPQEFMFD